MDYIYIEKSEDGVSYEKCSVTQISEQHYHHFALVSNNHATENDRVSSIDIDQIKFKNWDADAYQDKKALEAEKLELSAKNKNIRQQEDGKFHAADLMAHKI